MSPFDVHYNRAPLAGEVRFVRRHAALGENAYMTEMHVVKALMKQERMTAQAAILQWGSG